MPLQALQNFINSVYKLSDIPLSCQHYTCISKRAKTVDIPFKTKTRSTIEHLAIDSTGLKVYGECECEVKKHGTEGKHRVWCKLHITVDTQRHKAVHRKLALVLITSREGAALWE